MTRFMQKRAEQLAATERIMEKSEYELRYKLTQALVDEMFRALRKAQRVLESTTPPSLLHSIPTDNATLLTALVTTWEHTSFLSDLVLRLPDLLHPQIDDHAVRTAVLRWALATCLASSVFESPGLQRPLLLAQQELAYVPHDPDYTNPYRHVDDSLASHNSHAAAASAAAARGPRPKPVRSPDIRGAADVCPGQWPAQQ